MKVSYNWLQTYFNKPLPSPEKLADLLTFHVFEIESIDKIMLAGADGRPGSSAADTVLDVKVLPDRAHYDLAHRGIASEVALVTGLEKHEVRPEIVPVTSGKKVVVKIDAKAGCPRYMARFVGGVKIGDSPAWLRERLLAVGQRSINNIVDAVNYVMLDLGQPLHAFDAAKVEGGINVRFAKKGEKIVTLDGKEVVLDDSVLVIVDDAGPLAIAGIKGGDRAAVTLATEDIIIESANFNASLIRKTTQKLGIRSDSSKRYENEITPELTAWGMSETTRIIADTVAAKVVGEITDIYPKPVKWWTIRITPDFINAALGTVGAADAISEKEIDDILTKLHVSFIKEGGGTMKSGTEYILTPPPYRLDLKIPEDIVEEIGRVHGYEKVKPIPLPDIGFKPAINKDFYYCQKIRAALVAEGFSEVYTYSLENTGDVEILNPLASDKNYARKNLAEGIAAALELNAKNADLLGLDQIKIFEIGKVFTKRGEFTNLCIGVKNAKKLKVKEADVVSAALQKISLVPKEGKSSGDSSLVEIILDDIIKKSPEALSEPASVSRAVGAVRGPGTEREVGHKKTVFRPISTYPFAVRDIAVFVPEQISPEQISGEKRNMSGEQNIRSVIEKEAGGLLVRNTLFDTFKKEGKVSYAFRLVFQSDSKTLTDAEINDIMSRITVALNAKPGWQVR